MRTKIVLEIFKKEMLDILRDKKTLFMMIILPIMLYPLIMVGFSQVLMMSMSKMEEQVIKVQLDESVSEDFSKYFFDKSNDEENKETIIVEQLSGSGVEFKKEYKKQIEEGKLDAYIIEEKKGNILNYKVYTSNSSEKSIIVQDKVEKILNSYKDEIVKNNLENLGLDVNYILDPVTYENVDLAKNEEKAGIMLGQILPFILVMGVLLGAIYPAIDVMAGEKERGTLETLLTLPISNLELIMGKYLSVSFSAIVTAILNISSIAATIAFLVFSQDVMGELGMDGFDMTKLIGPVIISIVCICLFAMVVSAISMCICSFAKSFKDAQNYITPLMLIIMIPSYACMLPSLKLTSQTAMIPVVNISLLIKSVMSFDSNIGLISIVLLSNLAFVILSVVLLSRIFNSEEVLFGENGGFSFLERRSNIRKGTLPNTSDGVVLYAFSLIALIYVGSLVQMKYGMAGIAMTQGFILLFPLLFAYYIKTDFKKVFSLYLPSLKNTIGSVILWMGGYLIVILITQFLLKLFPSNQEVVEALNDALFLENSLALNLIVVAVLPAICEEMLFRGFILSSFNKNGKSPKRAILLSSILFGLMHIDFVRIIPTTILGIILAYSVYKSGSLLVGCIIHFLNNGLAVVATHYANKAGQMDMSQTASIEISQALVMIGISIAFIYVGTILLQNKNSKKEFNA